jgi:hypothetical protein
MAWRRILCISDLHFPYAHKDSIEFLKAVKRKYKPDKIVCIGDEIDQHGLSYHESNPDLDSSGPELAKAKSQIRPLFKLFPEVDLLSSNHGDMVYRKAKTAGIPRYCVKSYGEILDAPKGWKWHIDLTLKMSDGRQVFFHHGKSACILKASQAMSMCMVQGHYHEKFDIRYWGNPTGLYWGMQIGCSIDDKSMAFAYNKTNLKRPIIGHGIIIDGQPHLLPMVMNKRGRWNKVVF